ncbi:MAG TPA: hypothetical protein VHV74_12175 [Pseudonocardiaceae bacterium]|nr:hypothetical protein [Pseudonocardiaceae bacterium]
MSGEFLLDTNIYQAFNSLDLLRQALSVVAGPPSSDPSDHQPGAGAPFDVQLGQIDWDKNAVTEIAAYVATNPAAPGTGATSRIEDAVAHLDDALWITQQTWTGAAADLMRAHTEIVKSNCEALKDELDQMNKDLNAEQAEQPDFSATQGMDKLTESVKTKAADIATATTPACETVLSKSPSDPDYLQAQQVVEARAAEMAEYVQKRIGEIPSQVLTHVEKHNATTVQLRDPRQGGAPPKLEEFSYQDYGLVRAASSAAQAVAQLEEAKKDLERAAAPPTEAFGISAPGMNVINVWMASVHLRIDDLEAVTKQANGVYGALEETHRAYQHAEWKNRKELEKLYSKEYEEDKYDQFSSGDTSRSDTLDDALTWHDIKELEGGAWDGMGVPPEGGDEGTGEGGGGDGVGGGGEEE